MAVLSDEEQCDTLQTYCGDTVWAFFRKPKGLPLRVSARELVPGVSVLVEGGSYPVPAWSECASDISAVPNWLRELAFEVPDNPSGKAAPVPGAFPHLAACRPAAPLHRSPRKGHPVCNQAGWRGGYRIYRQR